MITQHDTPRGALHTGRAARAFGHVTPLGAVRACQVMPLPPLPVTLTQAHSSNIAFMFLNNQYGCCTCAGMANAIELVTADAQGTAALISDADVLQTYELNCPGFSPGPPVVGDNGCNEQEVLRWWQNVGFPLNDGSRLKAGPVFELNPKNISGICEAIMEFGFVYIGFEVPSGFMEALPALWSADPSYGDIVGGHCVLLHGFDRTNPSEVIFNVTSWGTNEEFRMRQDFLLKYVDEIYAVFLPPWVEQSGKTPYDLDITQLEALGGEVGTDLTASTKLDHGALEAAKFGVTRNPHWHIVEREVLEEQPNCIACDPYNTVEHVGLQVHHKQVSFHVAVLLGRPDLEMDKRNLCTLGETEHNKPAPDHHLLLGHGNNFQRDCNPFIDQDVVTFRGMTTEQIKGSPVFQQRMTQLPRPFSQWTRDEKIAKRKELDTKLPPDNAVIGRFPNTEPVKFDDWLSKLV